MLVRKFGLTMSIITKILIVCINHFKILYLYLSFVLIYETDENIAMLLIFKIFKVYMGPCIKLSLNF